jgi:histidyl-tRNA synthetase
MQDDKRLFELEALLDEAKRNNKEQIWKECKSFPKYMIDNYGHVKSLCRVVNKICPAKTDRKYDYVFKEKILKHLHTGIDQRWTTVVLIGEKENSRHQLSVAKLIVSTFLDIDLKDLPRQIYFIDGDSKNIVLQNLSFFRKK